MTLNPITRILAGRTAMMVIGILVIVEAVFVSESFTTLLEITIRFGGGAGALAVLLLLKMPEIIGFGLPIALLIGFYFAVTMARDNSELIVCAAAGVSWRRLPAFALLIGTLGMGASLLVSGYGVPMANYAKRMAVAQMYSDQITRQLLTPSPKITLQEMADKTLITVAAAQNIGAANAPRGNLFVHHTSQKGAWHVSLAQNWQVTRAQETGMFTATLNSFTDYWGQSATAETADQPLSTTRVQNMSIDFELADLLREIDRTRRKDEVFLGAFGAIFKSGTGDFDLKTDVRTVFGEKIARALLCPAAALLALFAAALSQFRFGRLTALPVALGGVLGLDILGREILGAAAISGAIPLGLATLAVVALFVLPPLLFLALNGERVIFPVKDPAG